MRLNREDHRANYRRRKILRMAESAMRAHHLVLRTKGKTRARTPKAFYGFRADDIVEMYIRKSGSGAGLWYRLKDGRVVDAFGRPSDPNRRRYKTKPLPRWPVNDRVRR